MESLLTFTRKVQKQLECIQNSTSADLSSFLTSHQQFLIGIINEMRDLTVLILFFLNKILKHDFCE